MNSLLHLLYRAGYELADRTSQNAKHFRLRAKSCEVKFLQKLENAKLCFSNFTSLLIFTFSSYLTKMFVNVFPLSSSVILNFVE